MLQKEHASAPNLIFGSTDIDAVQKAFDSKWESGVPYTVLLAPGGKVLYEEEGEVNILKTSANHPCQFARSDLHRTLRPDSGLAEAIRLLERYSSF